MSEKKVVEYVEQDDEVRVCLQAYQLNGNKEVKMLLNEIFSLIKREDITSLSADAVSVRVEAQVKGRTQPPLLEKLLSQGWEF